eukprot:COSAG01_NODE_13722_length_1544_cov_1.101730_1_plen_55_part_10
MSHRRRRRDGSRHPPPLSVQAVPGGGHCYPPAGKSRAIAGMGLPSACPNFQTKRR